MLKILTKEWTFNFAPEKNSLIMINLKVEGLSLSLDTENYNETSEAAANQI